VYDGDCAFCTRCVRLVERLKVDAELVAWQFADLAELGLTQAQVDEAVQWVGLDGTIASGHLAVAATLRQAGGIWRASAWTMTRPGISWLAGRVYRWVADHRDLMPGGTAACALPPDQRPGASSA
jgi:predicted DCC family thiol-disulfide oxidoreductase YuxK